MRHAGPLHASQPGCACAPQEEYMALIAYQKVNKEAGNEWFTIESNKTGTRWTGKGSRA